ncbi:hypothetical protein KSP35_13215 [Aquihabitans sp. G128]|uniref:hypothetical protein n=1 Tax=Aquihabitans sp. G128 TaxID=2849779 RepID=UPI001C24D608|nr:hypothetical protein [Aquihabitans sp. G128]QXC59363.1 hypothetical protein KSP35_13215 [Aquihabitans sp. G128]
MPDERNTEVVPGMAEAIEQRRKELGMSPGDFTAATGLTGPGVMPVRKGYRRQYQDRVKLGVARALQWPPDAIDRLMAGEDPDPRPPGPALALDSDVIGLAARAGKLSPEQRAKVEGYIEALLDEDTPT